MTHDIKEQLESLRRQDGVNPDRTWMKTQRSILLGQIRATTRQSARERDAAFVRVQKGVNMAWSMFIPQRMAMAARSAMTLLLVCAVAVGGWAATVSASFNSVPGDRLYQVKLATENVQNAVATIVSSDEETIKSDINRAKRRAEEIREAVKKVQEDPSRKTKVNKVIKEVAVKELEESVRSAEEKLQHIAEINEDNASDVAKQVSEDTKIIKETLEDAALETPANAVQNEAEEKENAATEEETRDAVTEVVKKVSDVGINALATAVEKRGEDDDVSLRETIQKKITELSDDASGSLQIAEDLLKTYGDAEKTETEGEMVNTSTPALASVSQDDIAPVAEAVTKTSALSKEISDLLEENALLDAIEKVRELHAIVSGIQESVNTLRKQVVDTGSAVETEEDVEATDTSSSSEQAADQEAATSTVSDSQAQLSDVQESDTSTSTADL